MSNGVIQYNVEDLTSAGSQFSSYAEEVKGVFDQLTSVNEDLASSWQGPARDKFVEMYAEVSPQFEGIVQLILSAGGLMKDVAENISGAEQAAVSGMGIITG